MDGEKQRRKDRNGVVVVVVYFFPQIILAISRLG